MMKSTIDTPDWSTIPAPLDDGATRHLASARMPSIPLQATNGDTVDLSAIPGRVVVYAYPRTGRPSVENPVELTAAVCSGERPARECGAMPVEIARVGSIILAGCPCVSCISTLRYFLK